MKKESQLIMAIESSCDEASVAFVRFFDTHFEVLSHVVYSQIEIHQKTHGVVPEVAARKHVETFPWVLDEAITKAGVGIADVDCIAVTYGPGLIGSLMMGVQVAKSLALAYHKPLVAINHLRAHLQTAFFDLEQKKYRDVKFPMMGLLVSGGHTELVHFTTPVEMKIIGQTLDDAIGESFDKVATLLNLPYPGGPHVSKMAQQGDVHGFDLPIAMKHSHDYNVSYSGLKTAVRDLVKKNDVHERVADVCASFEYVALEQILQKTVKAVQDFGSKTLCMAGGVSANRVLRSELVSRFSNSCEVIIPPFEVCTDNALMIALSAYIELQNGAQAVDYSAVMSKPNLSIEIR
ncbi:tRNA (adenosine(37)-N6)-threonylcarbamoyltransferase complex transferase subunit TsaD [Candidatus Falkowbacteria bacterium]|nr:tRNA (adenosine(37)-N6)-threonylcarbamoyltransferase complex transferase subunit TsaD [Candidatus Falkowbacteria bacterium]